MTISLQRRNMQMRNPMMISAVFAALLIGSAPMAQERGTAKPNPPLVREIVKGMPRGENQEVRVLTATLKPGDKTPFHTHRFPVTVYVLEGTFTLELEGRGTVTVKAGQAMVEPPNVKMTGYNRSSTEPLRVVIFYVSDPDTPFLDPAHR
jgi:quercetin dioxygenase-like cupin family protein